MPLVPFVEILDISVHLEDLVSSLALYWVVTTGSAEFGEAVSIRFLKPKSWWCSRRS